MAVARREQLAQHRLEIVDVAVDVPTELAVGLVMLLHRAHFAAVEQADCTASENAAITAQV